jgi:hypothetical protein
MLRGGHVAAGTAKALHQTQLDRMSDEGERDRDVLETEINRFILYEVLFPKQRFGGWPTDGDFVRD